MVNVWKEKGEGGGGVLLVVGGFPASSALGLQGVETAFVVQGITGEVGRSKQPVWRNSGPASPPHLEVHQIHPGSVFQNSPLKCGHFPEQEGEGNMSDWKPSHASSNGTEKSSVRKSLLPRQTRTSLYLSYSATVWPPGCSQQLMSCRSSPSIQDEPSAASALSPNENRPLLGTCWNVTPPLKYPQTVSHRVGVGVVWGGGVGWAGQHAALMSAAKPSVVNQIHLRATKMKVAAERLGSHSGSAADHICDQVIGRKLRPTLQSWEKRQKSL